MVTTEKEAKKKNCCGPVGCGKALGLVGERQCLSSKCMAWEWHDLRLGDKANPETTMGYCAFARGHE